MTKDEIKTKLRGLCSKEKKIYDICIELGINEYEVLSLVRELRDAGINIITKIYDDDLYLYDLGEKCYVETNNYSFNTDSVNEFKFVAISDTRIGSKSQQLSILNDIYSKAWEMGYHTVIHCGNLTEGVYSISDAYADTVFLDDTLRQVDYIIKNYPRVEGIKTYFITGNKDEKHLKANKLDIGKRISDSRDDMIYLGYNSCSVNIDNASMLIFNPKLGKTYTVSYRAQQQVDSFRSEDKPDILLYGGLLQMEKFNYRNVNCISVPSVCATTKEMNDRRYSNTIGAWYITVKTDDKGNFKSISAIDSVYYSTAKNDYQQAKTLTLRKAKHK